MHQHAPLTRPAPRAQYDNQLLQLFTSSLFIAGLLSSLVASWTTSRLGRRATMLMAGLAFCIGAALTAGAVHLAMLVVGRIMLGVGVGFANQARARLPPPRALAPARDQDLPRLTHMPPAAALSRRMACTPGPLAAGTLGCRPIWSAAALAR